MVRAFAALVVPLVLVACSDEVAPEDQERRDAEAVAMVESANAMEPPLEEIAPDILTDADMAEHNIAGARCIYMPGTNGGPRLITRSLDAFIKLDGEVQRLAADAGSLELAEGTRTIYNGRAYVVRLEMADGEGRIAVSDAYDRLVYAGDGPVSCMAGERAPDNPDAPASL
ncbi:MAG: hypothetical protein ABIT10_10395 [Alteraurantiacibacter sp.]